jgi:SAM-dependent methyltransferase
MAIAGSSGCALSDEAWLDTHTAACLAEYRAFVEEARFLAGEMVLDLGSGSGSFVPFLSEAVWPKGRVVCVDLAVENCRVAGSRALDADGVGGSMLALPFRDRSFDAVWCANVTQYLTEGEMVTALQEMKRVVCPGGRVAVKDVDMLAFKVSPAEPFLFAHLAEACARAPKATPESAGSLRGRELRRILEWAGLVDVRQHSVFIERWAPLTEAEQRLWSDWLCYLGGLALKRRVPARDREAWREIIAKGAVPFVRRPDFYGCEAQVLAVGTVPA